MWRSPSASKRVRVQAMSEMKDTMEAEYQEMIRTLERANSALARIFNVEEGEDDSMIQCDICGEYYEHEEEGESE